MQNASELLKYPIGKHHYTGALTPDGLAACLSDIATLPVRLRQEVETLSAAQLDTPYRPEGWTVLQVVHHLSDSHLHAYIRFKLALTEDKPVIKPYKEGAWAELEDGRKAPLDLGLKLIDALHMRWMLILRSLRAQDLIKSYVHPQHSKEFTLDEAVSQYAWHSNHHLAHIVQLKKRKGWL